MLYTIRTSLMDFTELIFYLRVFETFIFSILASVAFRKPTTQAAKDVMYFYGLWFFLGIAFVNNTDSITIHGLFWVSRIALAIAIYSMSKPKSIIKFNC